MSLPSIRFFLLVLVFPFWSYGQVQNLYFVRKGRSVVFDREDYRPQTYNAFYIYRNCEYVFVLQDGKWIKLRVMEIRKDSIYGLVKNGAGWDSVALSPSQLKKMKLIADGVIGINTTLPLHKCRYVFEDAAKPKIVPYKRDTVMAPDSSHSVVYEVTGYLVKAGMGHVYERCGVTYYYEGRIGRARCEDSAKVKFVLRKGVWFTPSGATLIKGVNVGFVTANIDDNPMEIRGVNLSGDAASFLMAPFFALGAPFGNELVNMPDTVEPSDRICRISGVSLSAGGVGLQPCDIRGVSFNGGICLADRMRGVVFTGLQNIIQEFHGVEVGGLRNKTIKGRGVQIGLLNVCKDMKGIQIGLWNVNKKRKLPLINWG